MDDIPVFCPAGAQAAGLTGLPLPLQADAPLLDFRRGFPQNFYSVLFQ